MTDHNSCNCHACNEACTVKPGWFHPDQIAPLAAAMGISEQELFDKHLLVDWWDNYGDEAIDVFLLSPDITAEHPGGMFRGDPHGRCRWFVDGKCEIHTLGKPAECAHYIHGMPHDTAQDFRLKLVESWLPHQNRIAKLLGQKPIAEVYDPPMFSDLLISSLLSGTGNGWR